MALPYLTLAQFKARTLMSPSEVDYVETDSPGFTVTRIAVRTSWMHQRLRKRYGLSLPFETPPEILLGWLVDMVTWDVMRRRGLNPNDPAGQLFSDAVTQALAEIKEAADSKDGLFDIAEAADESGSSVTTGGPLGYSEASPYTAAALQGQAGRAEDRSRGQ